AEVLAGRRTVELRTEPARAARPAAGARMSAAKAAAADLSPEQVTLFEALRVWRGAQSKEQGVPAYIIFGDATLLAIAATKPATLADLDGISGVGAKKLDAYGPALLEVVAAGT
ncbi:MAG: HRDC domain-containing protein, partial [Cryobacterium sp.]|nr:HRDC domain-containing protein [Cryobacterium sp.]